MATLSIKSRGKTYPGGVAAVSGVNVDIADGAFIVLIGPSGCGKPTILRMIAGLEGTISPDRRSRQLNGSHQIGFASRLPAPNSCIRTAKVKPGSSSRLASSSNWGPTLWCMHPGQFANTSGGPAEWSASSRQRRQHHAQLCGATGQRLNWEQQ